MSQGVNLGVYPSNPDFLVQRLMKRLKYDPTQHVSLVGIKDSKQIHLPCMTILNAFTYFLDITSPPRKVLLKILAQYAEDKKDLRKIADTGKSCRS